MKKNSILEEITHHFPFTVISVCFALCVMAFLSVILDSHEMEAGTHDHNSPFANLFHVFHPIHLLLSATATTAMFLRFEKKIIKAVLVGLTGSLGVCGISDIVMPYFGGSILDIHMHFHFCLIEEPGLVIPFAAAGVLVGLATSKVITGRGATLFSHSGHVVVSTTATLLYLISYGFGNWMTSLFSTFVVVIFAVILPCCLSDIFFPLLMAAKARERHDHEGGSHCNH
jgi:hypothetical protein